MINLFSDTFDARFGAQPFSDPAIMSVAPRDIFPTGRATHTPQLGPNMHGQVGPSLVGYQSPPGMNPAQVLSPPPGFPQPTGRPQPIRQSTQPTNPMVLGAGVAGSPLLATGEFLSHSDCAPGVPSHLCFPCLRAYHTFKLRRPLCDEGADFIF